MARARKSRKSGSTSATGATENNIQTNTTERNNSIMGLDPSQIRTLLSGARTKGLYVEKLNEFIESGENGVCANEQWVEFEDKKPTTLKQGFDNARDSKAAADGSDQIKVMVSDEKVYLINLAVVGAEDPSLVGTEQ
jgi:hypothetical protein